MGRGEAEPQVDLGRSRGTVLSPTANAARLSELVRAPSYHPIAVFEEARKKHFGCPFAKAHCNGTSALTSAIFALELPPGSEVLVASYSTWFPLAPIRLFGLVPRFVDVDPRTMNIDIEGSERHGR